MKKPNLFLLLGALVLVVAIGLPAFAGNVFNVEKIAVDVTAGSASDARAAAFARRTKVRIANGYSASHLAR